MPTHQFPTPERLRVFVENQRGQVTVRAEETAETTVEIHGDGADRAVVELDGDRLSVLAPRDRGFFSAGRGLEVSLTVPSGSLLAAKLGSSRLTSTGDLAELEIRSGSGDVQVERVLGDALVETGSGEIRLGRADAALRVKSGSGDVRVDAVAELSVSTGSGDVHVGSSSVAMAAKTGSGDVEVTEADGDVRFSTGSGDLQVHRLRQGRLTSKGASGDVVVGIPSGVPVWTDISTVSGRLQSRLAPTGQPEPGAPHVELRVTTASGDVVLTPA